MNMKTKTMEIIIIAVAITAVPTLRTTKMTTRTTLMNVAQMTKVIT